MKTLSPQSFFKINFLLIFALISGLNSCGSASGENFGSLLDQQPRLLKVYPEPESTIEENQEFFLEFSHRVAMKSIEGNSISLIQGPIDPDFFKDTKALLDALDDQELTVIPCQYFLAANERELNLTPSENLSEGLYYLMITPHLRSTEALPFNQTPGESPSAFLAAYGLGKGLALLPTVTQEDQAPLPSYGNKPSFLVINELLYDGKASETDGESFIELYGTPGADISDYFIAFINGSDGAETDVITLPLGTILKESGLLVIADLHTNSETSTQVSYFDYLEQFDPQNGPDAVQIFDREGNLLDVLGYGEGSVSHSMQGFLMGEGQPALDVSAGVSLSRAEGLDTNDNKMDFLAQTEPSPGAL